MDTEDNKTMNFYFGKEVREIAKKPTDESSITYIILQNDKLHLYTRKLEQEIATFRLTEQDLEDTIESLESSARSVKEFIRVSTEYINTLKGMNVYYNNVVNKLDTKDKISYGLMFCILQGLVIISNFSWLQLSVLFIMYAYMFYIINLVYSFGNKSVVNTLQDSIKNKEKTYNLLLPEPTDCF